MNDWKLSAACRGMDTNIFFPTTGYSLEPAVEVCDTCPDCSMLGRAQSHAGDAPLALVQGGAQ